MEASSRFKRFKVVSVKVLSDVKILKMECVSTGGMYACRLSDSWYGSYVSEGDIVHVESEKLIRRTYYVDDEYGLITIGPDRLVYATTLSKAFSCMRRAWLGRLFTTTATLKSIDESSLVGEIVHDIFQTACMEKSYSQHLLEEVKKKCLQKEKVAKSCFANGLDKEEITEKVDQFLPSILSWFDKNYQNISSRKYYEVGAVKDIEENMCSPSLGIEGSVDASFEVEIHSRPSRKVLVPLELKTGRAFTSFSDEQKIQAMSYSMGMKERGPTRDTSALLLYLKNKRGEFKPEMTLLQMQRWEQVELLQKRNELTYFSSPYNTNFVGPDFVKSTWQCDRCQASFACSLMAHSFEKDKIQESSPFRKQLIKSELSHLRPEDIKFFKKWMHFLRIKEPQKAITSFWTEPSAHREAKKLGLSDLKVHKISDRVITFRRNPDSQLGISLNFYHDLAGKKVAISEEESSDVVPTRVALLIGEVLFCTEEQIEIQTVKEIGNFECKARTYRLDLMNSDLPFSHFFGNLLSLMSEGEDIEALHGHRLRRTIIMNPDTALLKVGALDLIYDDKNHQLLDQPEILKSARNCLLIHRLPGFRKQIVKIVEYQSSLEFKQNFLISSHSYSTLDAILVELKNSGIDFVRLGPGSSISSEIAEFSHEEKLKKVSEDEGPINLKQVYRNIRVTGIKCSDVPFDPNLVTKVFNICIIDEADKIPFPIVLDLLSISWMFILIGDESPLTTNEDGEMNIEHYGESFFKMMWNTNRAIVQSSQYHMNEEIMSYSNRLFYRNSLKCGSQDTAHAVILPASNLTGHLWLDKVLSDELCLSFLFLDTDCTGNLDANQGQQDIIQMQTELCSRIVKEFIHNNGISPTDIAILGSSQSQISLIKKMLKELEEESKEIFVNTIDKSQNEGRMIVLILFSNHGNSEHATLSDSRRLRTALTRAARKLIFIGSKSYLELHEPFRDLFDLMREEQFVSTPEILP